ncbi:tripartite tricarboxylate transporter substrate binding protein [Muricoccus radiodurans]|uniref:tripartite tricarboxylate transporter substrate binding protein n=1 Tax=Muricoccus radiodurans TaxID=2231721 RepID=UPI003CE7B23D
MRRRSLMLGVAGAAAAALPARAAFPERPIRVVVPYGPGGITDIAARIVAPRLGEELGATCFVENRAGGAGMIGFNAAARSAPDGYTIVLATTALAANPVLFRTIPYDARTDFAPISLMGVVPTVLVVPPNGPATLAEFVARAKAQPGRLNFGSAGNGSGNHLSAELFNAAAGIQAVHVPYRGGGQVMTDLVSGQLSYVLAVLPTAYPFITSGQLRALAVTGTHRSTAVPEVPTVAEALVPGFEMYEWLGLFAPAGTPPELIGALNAAVLRAVRRPEIDARLRDIGVETVAGSPEDLRIHLDRELNRWAELARQVRFEVAD